MKFMLTFLPLQGSDGFPGALGAPGEKGKKVSEALRTHAVKSLLCFINV